ncbi:histone-lysine N-methyltransferase SETMAR-like [Euwallacea similis]|uniref:histone-lysine N-methyltransferase SETMAR-like n=1 Tax=Euwallacea similis TaxID=1736056 RepID=UPI00344E999A
MYDFYVGSYRNCRTTAKNYHQLYPERQQPNPAIFSRLSRNLATYDSFQQVRLLKYRPKTANINEINVLAQIEINPVNSSRNIANECNIHDSTVRKILEKNKLHDYKFLPVQTSHEDDAQRRLEFCNWYTGKLQDDLHFSKKVLWTDESFFTNSGIFNRKNQHFYSTVNLHLMRQGRPQIRFSLNVWAGIIGNKILGPVFINNRLNGRTYANFLQDDLENLMEEVPLAVERDLWFLNNGAPPHNSNVVRQILNNKFPNKWMGIYEPIRWPPRSPCLNPLNFFLWGTVRNDVFATVTNNLEHLEMKITNSFQVISQESVLRPVDQMGLKTRLCVENNGGHFEQLLN